MRLMNFARSASGSFWFGHAVAVIACVACMLPVFMDSPPPYCRTFPGVPSLTSSDERQHLQKLFDRRLDQYKAKERDLQTNMRLQSVFIVVSMMLLIRHSKTMNLSVFGTEVPLSWLHFLVPLAMMSLWMQFGFLLDDMLNERLACWRLLDALGDPRQSASTSSRSLFHDGGFIDGWLIHFAPGMHNIDSRPSWTTALYFGTVYGLFVGWAHACVITLLHVGNRRFLSGNPIGRASLALPWIAYGLIIASHFHFAYNGRNPNWIQFAIAFYCVLVTYALLWLARHADGPAAGRDAGNDPLYLSA